MTTVVDQVITIFDAVWKGEGAAKSSMASLQQYRAVSSRVAISHQQWAGRADAAKASMMGLGAEVAAGKITTGKAAQQFEVFNQKLTNAEANMERLIPTTTTASAKFKQFAATAGTAVVALAAVGMALKATYAAMKQIYDAAAEGAGLIQLRDSFNLLNTTAMQTPDLLRDMVAASHNTISEMAAMEGVMTLVAGMSVEMTKNFAEAAPTLMDIAKAANKLNPTLGDTAFMFNSIARGIKRQEPRLLDNLGLNVKVAMASQMYADKMGIAITAMSAEDKQQALLNETLRVGKLLIDQVGGSTESAADGYLALAAATEDYKNAHKEAWGAAKVGNKTLAETIKASADERSTRTALNKAVEAGVITQKASNKLMADAIFGHKEYADVIKVTELLIAGLTVREMEAAKHLQEMATQVGEVGDSWMEGFGEGPQKAVSNMGDVIERTTLETRQLKEEMLGLSQGVKNPGAMDAMFASWNLAAAESAVEQIDDLIKSIREMDAATGDYAMQAYNAEEGSGLFNESIEQIGESWVRVGGRTKEQNELLEDLQSAYDKSDKQVRDYTSGLKGYGMEQDKINDKLEDGAGAAAHYLALMEPLRDIQGDLVKVNKEGTWNQENINKAILDAGDEYGASASEMVKFLLATGEITDAQAEAILEQSKMAEAIALFGQQMDDGIPAEKIIADVEAIKTSIKNLDLGELLGDYKKVWRDVDASKFEEGIPIPAGQWVEVEPDEDPDTLIQQLQALNKEWEAVIKTDGVDVAQGEVDALHAALIAIAKNWKVSVDISTSGSIPHSPDDNIPQGQFGGPMQQGTSYWVGERGPELFTPNVNGNLAPTGSSGGGGNTTINNYNKDSAAIAMAMLGLKRRSRIDVLAGVA